MAQINQITPAEAKDIANKVNHNDVNVDLLNKVFDAIREGSAKGAYETEYNLGDERKDANAITFVKNYLNNISYKIRTEVDKGDIIAKITWSN